MLIDHMLQGLKPCKAWHTHAPGELFPASDMVNGICRKCYTYRRNKARRAGPTIFDEWPLYERLDTICDSDDMQHGAADPGGGGVPT